MSQPYELKFHPSPTYTFLVRNHRQFSSSLTLPSLLIKALIYYNNFESYNRCASLRFSPYINSYYSFPLAKSSKTYNRIRQWLPNIEVHREAPYAKLQIAGVLTTTANTAELEELRAELKREGAETHPPNRVFLCNGNVSENVSLNEQIFLIIIYALFCTGNNTCNQWLVSFFRGFWMGFVR